MKEIIYISLMAIVLSGCTATGPAVDRWDEEAKEDRLSLGSIFGGNKSKKENEQLRTRLEELEQQQRTGVSSGAAVNQPNVGSDITAPPASRAPNSSSTTINPQWQNSASYQEWKRAKEGGTTDYRDFQEYKEWLEFQKLKKQNQ